MEHVFPSTPVTPWSAIQKRSYRSSALLETSETASASSEKSTRVEVPINTLTVGVPKESFEGEKRVALTPKNVEQLKKAGFSVIVEKGAGVGAKLSDAEYEAAGATIVDDLTALSADIVLKVTLFPIFRLCTHF